MMSEESIIQRQKTETFYKINNAKSQFNEVGADELGLQLFIAEKDDRTA